VGIMQDKPFSTHTYQVSKVELRIVDTFCLKALDEKIYTVGDLFLGDLKKVSPIAKTKGSEFIQFKKTEFQFKMNTSKYSPLIYMKKVITRELGRHRLYFVVFPNV
jgi:hypothetical protein